MLENHSAGLKAEMQEETVAAAERLRKCKEEHVHEIENIKEEYTAKLESLNDDHRRNLDEMRRKHR